jgi:hypothetical protein
MAASVVAAIGLHRHGTSHENGYNGQKNADKLSHGSLLSVLLSI